MRESRIGILCDLSIVLLDRSVDGNDVVTESSYDPKIGIAILGRQLGLAEATRQAGERIASDPELSYRADFVEEAREVWSGNPDIRDEFNAIRLDDSSGEGQPGSLA